MAFKLDGKPLAVDVAFSHNDINYPANWLRLASKTEKEAIGITEEADDPVFDSRFYWGDGTAKALDDVNATYAKDDPDGKYKKGDLMKDENGNQVVTQGVKSVLKAQEKATAGFLLAKYDWQVVRKAEKGTALDSDVVSYRDGIRTAYTTRKTEIDDCADTAALVTLYSQTEETKTVTDEAGQKVVLGTGVFKFNMTQYPADPNN